MCALGHAPRICLTAAPFAPAGCSRGAANGLPTPRAASGLHDDIEQLEDGAPVGRGQGLDLL